MEKIRRETASILDNALKQRGVTKVSHCMLTVLVKWYTCLLTFQIYLLDNTCTCIHGIVLHVYVRNAGHGGNDRHSV